MKIENTQKVDILIEALPYISRFKDIVVVVKYGGNAMINDALKKSVMQDVLLMQSVGIKPIVVHGGGPFIDEMLDKLGMESHFEQGLRVTDAETMKVVEMVLAGQVNKEIVDRLNQIGGCAVGLSGKDGRLIQAKKKVVETRAADGKVQVVDLGFVGEVEAIDTAVLKMLVDHDFVPVISSIGFDEKGDTYNINADDVAGEIAVAVKADKFILLTDTVGVLEDAADEKTLYSELSIEETETLIQTGVIAGGMVPKVKCCVFALKNGVPQAHIVDGRLKHSILLELFFDAGIGTMFVTDKGADANG